MEIKKIKYYFMAAGLLFLAPLFADAAVPEWQIVSSDSQLLFTATQNGAPISGEFKRFSGTLFVDTNDLKHSSIHIIVDITSINTSYNELKETLVSADWFNAKLFPNAEFKSTDIEKTNDTTYQAKGILTIRDKSEPVILTFSTQQISTNKAIVKGHTVIKRTLFGVGQGEWSGTNEIKDEVNIDFKVVGVKKITP